MLKTTKLPFKKARRGPAPKYPFATMKVKESFVVARGTVTPRSFAAYICARARALDRKFLMDRLPGGDIQVYRER